MHHGPQTEFAWLDLNRKRRANVVDRTAAAWILQGALDRLRDAGLR